jgi:hypothetical protein
MKFKNFMMPMALVLAAGCYAADQGTKEDPLTIGTVQELLQFRNAVSDSGMYKGVKLKNAGEGLHFKLTADLDLSSVCGRDVGNWKAIGPFEGSFDGDGHKISNLYIDDSLGSVRDAGFIGPVFNNGDDTLYYNNVVFENVYIRHSGLIGTFVTQVVTGQAVVRNNSVELTYETVDKENGAVQWGGLMGNTVAEWVGFYDNTVKGSMKAVNQKQAAIGGIIGVLVDPGAIEGNVNEANITVEGNVNTNIGGIVGELLAPCTFKNNVNKGDVSANVPTESGFVGGLVGVVPSLGSEKTVVGNLNYGKVELTASYAAVGGLFGYISGNTNTTLDSCINYGDVIYHGAEVQQMVQVGGVAGIWEVKQASRVENKGKIVVENAKGPFVGGIAGFVRPGAKSADLFKAVNEGDIELKTSADSVNGWVSGLVGSTDEIEYLRLDSCVNKGNVLLPENAKPNILFSKPLASTLNSDVQLMASTSVNEGNVPDIEPPMALASLRHTAFAVRTWKKGAGSLLLEVTGLTPMELGKARVQVFSLDGRRLPVSVKRSGNVFELASAGQQVIVRLYSPNGNKTLIVH